MDRISSTDTSNGVDNSNISNGSNGSNDLNGSNGSNDPTGSKASDNTPPDIFDQVDLSVAPMATEDVEKRLQALHDIDRKVIEMLETASAAILALKTGKQSNNSENTEQAKTDFKQSTQRYFSVLEEVTVNLRREVRLLHEVSKDIVLPISVSAKAEHTSRVKEKEVWHKIDYLLESRGLEEPPSRDSQQNSQHQSRDVSMSVD